MGMNGRLRLVSLLSGLVLLGGFLLGPGLGVASAGTVDQPGCPLSPAWAAPPRGTPLTLLNGEPFVAGDPFVMLDGGVMLDDGALLDGGRFKMWHTAYVDGVLGIAYAESADGLAWKPMGDGRGRRRLVLAPTPGAWDRRGIETVSVVKKDGRYYLWYLGYPGAIPEGQGRNDFIGLATSGDGIHWRKYPGPVLTPDLAWERPFQRTVTENGQSVTFWQGGLQEPSVIWDEAEGLFKMWYAAKFFDYFPAFGRSFVGYRIGYATSPDGVRWTKSPEPVFEPTGARGTFDPVSVSHTDVIRDPRFGYHLFYAGGGAIDGIGHAFSRDGVTWRRDPANPIIQGQTTAIEPGLKLRHGAYRQAVGGPSAVIADGRIYLYYMRSEPGRRNFGGRNTLERITAPCRVARADPAPPEATLSADFARSVGQPSMSGFLSGISPRTPPDDLIRPLAPVLLRGDAATAAILDGLDAPAARHDLYAELGAWYVLMVSNMWGYPPTNFRDHGPPGDDLDAFRALVARLARKVRDSGLERVIFDVWNEPDAALFAPGDEAAFNRVYAAAEGTIRAISPDALVAGPTLSWYDPARIQRFLDFCLAAGCQVNVLTWQELLGPGTRAEPGRDIAEVADHLRYARRAWLDNPRYAPLKLRQIQINEYVGRPDQYRPGEIVAYLAALEAGGADAAAKSCWSREDGASVNCFNGGLDGLFTPESADRLAPWWVYRAYAETVAGRVAGASKSPRLALLAGLTAAGDARLLIGHPRRVGVEAAPPEAVVVDLKHLGAALKLDPGARVRIEAERVPNAIERPLKAPLEVVYERDLTLDDKGDLRADLGVLAEHEALIVSISPADK